MIKRRKILLLKSVTKDLNLFWTDLKLEQIRLDKPLQESDRPWNQNWKVFQRIFQKVKTPRVQQKIQAFNQRSEIKSS